MVATTEPSHTARRSRKDARIRSGLYVGGQDVPGFVWLGRQLRADEDRGRQLFDNALWRQEAGTGSRMGETKPGEESWVRFTRQGDKWTCGWSADGRKWTTWKVTSDLPDAVTVGVFLTHDADQKCEATFSAFSVTPLKNEK